MKKAILALLILSAAFSGCKKKLQASSDEHPNAKQQIIDSVTKAIEFY
jgi:hypothetical protein